MNNSMFLLHDCPNCGNRDWEFEIKSKEDGTSHVRMTCKVCGWSDESVAAGRPEGTGGRKSFGFTIS